MMEQVRDVAIEAIDRARRGDGPTLIEAQTYRFRGHSLADPDELRDKKEKEHWAVCVSYPFPFFLFCLSDLAYTHTVSLFPLYIFLFLAYTCQNAAARVPGNMLMYMWVQIMQGAGGQRLLDPYQATFDSMPQELVAYEACLSTSVPSSGPGVFI